jgi:hypothetical protein
MVTSGETRDVKLKPLLIGLGIATAILLPFPELVLIGYMGLILPGLLLSAIPSLFFYLAAFALIRARLPIRFAILRDLAALLLTVAIGAALPAPFYFLGRTAFEQAIRPDILPAAPVRLSGHIRVIDTAAPVTGVSKDIGRFAECEAVCAALLATPGVTAVTLAGADSNGTPLVERSYRIVAGDDKTPETRQLVRPEDIIGYLPQARVPNLAAIQALRDEVVTLWGLRFADRHRLVAETASGAPDQTITISRGRAQGPHRLAELAIELSDRAGRPLLLRQRVQANPVGIPLLLLPDAPHLFGFDVFRAPLLHGGRTGFDPVTVLMEHSNLYRPDGRGAGLDALSERLSQALTQPDDPSAAAALAMADAWFLRLSWRKLTADQITLIARLIADPRITSMRAIYDGWERFVAPELRDPIIQRLSQTGLPFEVQVKLNGLIAAMPAGSFARSTPAEDALLGDPSRWLSIPALVERQADRGAAAVPLFVSVIESLGRASGWQSQRSLADAVCRALIRLGPEAAEALPSVRAYAAQLTYHSQDRQKWNFARARMGEPIEQIIPLTGSDENKERLERDRTEVRWLMDRENREQQRR